MRAALAALCVCLCLGLAKAAEPPARNPFFASAAEERLFLETQKLRTDGKLSDALRHLTRGLSLSNGKPSFAAWTTEGALIFEGFGRYRDAEMAHKRALEALEHEIGPESPAVCVQLQLLARLYLRLDRLSEAERLLARALAISKKTEGAGHPSTALVLAATGEVHRRQGRFTDSEPLLQRAVIILETAGDAKRASLADSLTLLAYLYRDQRRIREAVDVARRAHEIDQAVFGPVHAQTARSAVNLAIVLDDVGRGAEAEGAYERALAIREKIFGPDHPETAQSLTALASHYADDDRLTDAERMLERALAAQERAHSPSHLDIAQTLDRLAFVYRLQGRSADAEPLYKRALAVTEKALGASHRDTAASLANLAAHYATTGREAEAESLLRRVIAIDEKRLGADHTDTATANLGGVLSHLGRKAEAERLLKRALAAFEKAHGVDHLSTAQARGLLAEAYWTAGRNAEADVLLRSALATYRKLLPAGHRITARNLHVLSQTSLSLGQAEDAYAAAKEAADTFAASGSRDALDELKSGAILTFANADVFAQKARAAMALADAKPGREAELRASAFDAAQRAAFDDTGRAVDRMAARFAARSANVANLLRTQRLELHRSRALDRAMIAALGSDHPTANAWAASMHRENADIAASLSAIDAALRRDGGAYADLADPRPLGIAEAQALLKNDEAIVLPLVGPTQTMVFALSKTDIRWATVSVTEKTLAQRVAALRRQLDPDEWRTRPLEPFDRAEAHRLYRELLAPVEPALKGKAQLFIVPTGALTSLPFSVLVTAEPQGGASGDADPKALRETAWLIKRHALTVLPSISSLKALRIYASKGSGSEPFAGFGDPAFASSHKAKAVTTETLSVAAAFRGTEPNTVALRNLAPLPQTATELRTLAKALGASDKADVYLRERATETQIKSLDLSRKRVIAFATHGLMAGEMGLGEPGLVFTPPATPREGDDGYLSASEVAGLNLKADWIILSACNTAAGDAPGAKGLSGLARAFFLAGAKSLLVSHWPVWDDAAMRLTTGTVANAAKEPARGRAEALRQAMLAVMNDASTPRFAHPAAWASFVVVGETRAD